MPCDGRSARRSSDWEAGLQALTNQVPSERTALALRPMVGSTAELHLRVIFCIISIVGQTNKAGHTRALLLPRQSPAPSAASCGNASSLDAPTVIVCYLNDTRNNVYDDGSVGAQPTSHSRVERVASVV